MRISDKGLKMTESFEGLKLTAYKDMVGVWTIGYGHTGPEVKEGLQWTQAQADLQLACDMQKVEEALTKLIPPNCTQGQFDALVDFGFNLGIGALRTVLAHPWAEIPEWLLKWNKARKDGVLQPVPGLTRRREAERALFLSVDA